MSKTRIVKRCAVTLLAIAGLQLASAQEWKEKIRGSWITDDSNESVLLADNNDVADIVVSKNAHSCVKQAATFLAQDIEKITGKKPSIVSRIGTKPFIRLATISKDTIPGDNDFQSLKGKWEAHKIKTVKNGIWLVGSNPRGTAFAVYTLSERIGVDPLYHWTGYTPKKYKALRIKAINYSAGEPTVKYRGLFHDDEDTLVKELDNRGIPKTGGTIDPAWYKRYFETSLRLRMNQVAPYTRATRTMDVQKMASDWGLFYTSHHYDILLSNPWAYNRLDLAKKRGVTGQYNWAKNRDGINKYWKGGLEENKELDCIYPVGLRGTNDGHYSFPKGTTQIEKNRVFSQAISDQVDMAKAMLPKDKQPAFHFTLYAEMLKAFQSGTLELPEDVILVWNDDGDAKMRALPKKLGKWKHGVYYHLAFYGNTTKQTAHTITPARVEEQFRNIVDAGATEYMLCNVSEMREHVMNTRFIAEICWDAKAAFSKKNAADRFTQWWSREYFGDAAAEDALTTYNNYFNILHSHDQLWQGAESLERALNRMYSRIIGDHHSRANNTTDAEKNKMKARAAIFDKVLATARKAQASMNDEQARFFNDNAVFPFLIDYYPTKAAAHIWRSLWAWPQKKMLGYVKKAEAELNQLEKEILKVEYGPFENWYKDTWIRRYDSFTNVHYSYYRMQDFHERYKNRFAKYKHRYVMPDKK